MKVIELFAGIGATRMALNELKIEEPLKPGKCLILEKKVAVCD